MWRNEDDGRAVLLRSSPPAGLEAIGVEADSAPVAPTEPVPAPSATEGRGRGPQRLCRGRGAGSGRDRARRPAGPDQQAPTEPRERKSREGTKQAQLIAMLKRPEGATIAEIVEATGWQPHTVRGALAGALKKRLGLERDVGEDRGARPGLPAAFGIRAQAGPGVCGAPCAKALRRPVLEGGSRSRSNRMRRATPHRRRRSIGLADAVRLHDAVLAGLAVFDP